MRSRSRMRRRILAIACLLVVAGTAGAVAPHDVTYQGLLLDSAGDPLAGPVDIEILICVEPIGGLCLYSEAHLGVTLMDGVFNILLGAGDSPFGSFDAALFGGENRYLEVTVNGEALEPRQPFSSVAYALQSAHAETTTSADTAGDADTVDGSHAADLDQSAHLVDTGNPHGLTPTQIGATPEADFLAHAAATAAHHAKTTTFAELTDQAADFQIPDNITIIHASNADRVDGQHASAFGSASQVATNQADIAALQADNATLQAAVSTLQTQLAALQDLLAHVSRSGNDLYVTGANLHVVDGSGGTDGAVNGLGNLIVGYNELRGGIADDRSGSHNIVVGLEHNFSSFGGLVAGRWNSIEAPYASVSGGRANTAGAEYSSVSGGALNSAGADYSSVSGGHDNTAGGSYSTVGGGDARTASGADDWVAGSLFEDY